MDTQQIEDHDANEGFFRRMREDLGVIDVMALAVATLVVMPFIDKLFGDTVDTHGAWKVLWATLSAFVIVFLLKIPVVIAKQRDEARRTAIAFMRDPATIAIELLRSSTIRGENAISLLMKLNDAFSGYGIPSRDTNMQICHILLWNNVSGEDEKHARDLFNILKGEARIIHLVERQHDLISRMAFVYNELGTRVLWRLKSENRDVNRSAAIHSSDSGGKT
jgi:hypothetical protein